MLAPIINEIIARKGINVSIYNMKKAQFILIERKLIYYSITFAMYIDRNM